MALLCTSTVEVRRVPLRVFLIKSLCNTEQTFTLELTEELIMKAEDSECDHLLRILNSATVEWSTSEERSDDPEPLSHLSIPIGKSFGGVLPFSAPEKGRNYGYLDGDGLAHLFLAPGSYNLTKMLTYKTVFNNGKITDGGRIYCGVQNIPKVFREGFRINGKPLVSVDLVSSHPRMLCHMKGIEMKDDLYSFETDMDVTRSQIKKNVNAALNDSNPSKMRMRDSVIASFAEAHPRLKEYLWSGVGVKLQAFEGKIARRLLDKWTNRKGRLFLCIHDGYMIESDIADEFCADMERFYSSIKELNGFKPTIEIK